MQRFPDFGKMEKERQNSDTGILKAVKDLSMTLGQHSLQELNTEFWNRRTVSRLRPPFQVVTPFGIGN